jgi:N-acetylmuramoyl-L-alanine amidase
MQREGNMHSEDGYMSMDRKDFLRLGGAGLAGAVLLGAARTSPAQTAPSLRTEFESASQKYGVPVELLLAMGYVNTLWEMPPPSDYEHGDIESRGTYGIMQLEQNPFRDTLGRAAFLTGLSEEQLKSDRASNIEGGAALLSEIVGTTKPDDLDGWQEAVSAYADTDLYTYDVYSALLSGASRTISTGESVELSPQDVTVPQVYTAQATADYPHSVWRKAHWSNYTSSHRERSYNINRVIIHVAQGSYAGTINWFQDRRADVSAHYVVSRKGGISQCVRNKAIAWHAGNWRYNCHSIGIEHAGYVSDPDSFTRKMYRASARLTAWCCKKHHISLDRRHIIGHYQVPGSDHTDPGRYWNWSKYMRFVKYYRRRL